MKLSINKLIL